MIQRYLNRRRDGCDCAADTYIADLFLRFLDSLELWSVCDLAETFSFILLKSLLIVNLHNKQHHVSNQNQNMLGKKCSAYFCVPPVMSHTNILITFGSMVF